MTVQLTDGLIFDTNALLEDLDGFGRLSAELQRRSIPCEVPAHVLAELVRNRAATKVKRAEKDGIPGARGLRIDIAAERLKLGAAKVLPFEEPDAHALVRWTEETYGSQEDYGRVKMLFAMRASTAVYRPAARTLGLLGEEADHEKNWRRFFAEAERVCRDGQLKKRASTNADWLTIGMAVARGRLIVTGETRSEFESFQHRCITLEALKCALGADGG